MVSFSLVGGGFIARFLAKGVSNGYVPGKLGAIHYAGTPQYAVSIGACALGLVLCAVVALMGVRFAMAPRR